MNQSSEGAFFISCCLLWGLKEWIFRNSLEKQRIINRDMKKGNDLKPDYQ